MRPDRKTRRARLLVTLASMEKRDAMQALALAVSDQEKSARSAERTRDLIANYQSRSGTDHGETFARRSLFVGQLASLADRARAAGREAETHIAHGKQALSAAERKLDRRKQQAQSLKQNEQAKRDQS